MPTPRKIASSASKELPKEIRDELRLTVAMRCYSVLRSGNAKSLNAQYEHMSALYHGNEPSIPSNLKMMCDGCYLYKELFDLVEGDTVTSKCDVADADSQSTFSLKVSLTRDTSRTYIAGRDIIVRDLEKKGRNGQQLVSGRNLLDLGKKGVANYKKALSFVVKKYDVENMKVLESGNSVEDVIEYVRVEMYQLHLKQEAVRKKTIVIDGDDLEDSSDLEDDYLSSINNSKMNNTDKESLSNSKVEHDKKKAIIDMKNKATVSDIDNSKKEKKKKNKPIPPKEWYFHSWICFLIYGPFAQKDKRISLLETSDAAKNVGKSRAEKRKIEKVEKDLLRLNDTQNSRGYSTDQKIQFELIDLTRQQTKDRTRESMLMGLSVQEQALNKQIDRAERMAERFALNEVDNLENKWWKQFHDLMKKQESLIIKMATINSHAIDNSQGGSNQTPTSNIEIPASNSNEVEVSSELTNDPKVVTINSTETDDFFECSDKT